MLSESTSKHDCSMENGKYASILQSVTDCKKNRNLARKINIKRSQLGKKTIEHMTPSHPFFCKENFVLKKAFS